jgi:sulfite reductase (ferredoxin)
MSDSTPTWKQALSDRIPADVAAALDLFETQMELRKAGKLDEKVFAELRLRRGAYGQRYDNGKRHDGTKTQDIPFPRRGLTKGPETEFDAPGMQRIKIPFGQLSAEQLEVLADCAEEYSNGILHLTTRQDVQLHFVDIEDTPDMHRRLASVGITTREACGNSVRNVTGCPFAGICANEAFDISPYARAETDFLLGHRDVQDFGRKFKIAFSGCADDRSGCGRAMMHDLGFIALTRTTAGREERGFRVVVGGGLGPVPHVAKELYAFLPVAEMLPVSQAIARVYARLGEKRNRNKARIKFLVAKVGIDAFRGLVDAERATLEPDPRWQGLLSATDRAPEYKPSRVTNGLTRGAAGFAGWRRTNVYTPRQPDFVAVLINLPLGDLTSRQARALADIVRRYTNDALRTTVDQNLLLRWVHRADLAALYNDLHAARLALPGANTVADVTSCPGTDTCKLGIASSRGLGAELRERLEARRGEMSPAVAKVQIRVSGCPNSCGLHHIGDIGFYGSSRNVGAYKVPHFQIILGGALADNAAHYGLALGAIPSKRAPELVDRLLGWYDAERTGDEGYRGGGGRVGKKAIKERIEDLLTVPSHDDAPEMYVDWHDSREYTIGDIGVGECAGEVVSLTQFGLAAAESRVFDASLQLDAPVGATAVTDAARAAYDAMTLAAQALIKTRDPDISADPGVIHERFREAFIDTGLFVDRFVGASQWAYYQAAHEAGGTARDADEARRRVEEAQLFIEAAHACYARLVQPQEVA